MLVQKTSFRTPVILLHMTVQIVTTVQLLLYISWLGKAKVSIPKATEWFHSHIMVHTRGNSIQSDFITIYLLKAFFSWSVAPWWWINELAPAFLNFTVHYVFKSWYSLLPLPVVRCWALQCFSISVSLFSFLQPFLILDIWRSACLKLLQFPKYYF